MQSETSIKVEVPIILELTANLKNNLYMISMMEICCGNREFKSMCNMTTSSHTRGKKKKKECFFNQKAVRDNTSVYFWAEGENIISLNCDFSSCNCELRENILQKINELINGKI